MCPNILTPVTHTHKYANSFRSKYSLAISENSFLPQIILYNVINQKFKILNQGFKNLGVTQFTIIGMSRLERRGLRKSIF